jgi:tetratricopeptide (TPR) repeat protein/KaiC/GvpD/RAD55 family RecA-like ATPase
VAVRETPLIDRVEEMKLLKEAVDRTIQGEGGLIFLYGEAGIGKTRLARELRAYAQLRGMQVLYGRCPALFRMDGVPPYVLWNEAIKDYLETCSPELLYKVIGLYPAEVAKLVPELRQKLGTIPQSFPISPQQEQNRLFEAVSQFITNISKEAPLLVVLDDLQWTDPSSLLLLHYLARGAHRTPLLLLGAYRSTDIDAKHHLTPVLTELNRERLLQSVSLKRMSLSDVSEMIKQMLKQDDVPAEFCQLVYEKTRGNPFFAEEVISSLKEEEVIYREEDKWKIKEVTRIEFPETVKSVIKARISRLDDESQDVLTLASFVGNDFTMEAMRAVTGIEESKLLELMDKMFKTGLIKERVIRGEGICSFADVLIRDVVYEDVSPLKRKKLHGVVGNSLEKVYATKVDEHLGELASHFVESGDKDKALDYFLKAGEKAQSVYANREAISYFQSALKLLEEKDGALQERGRVLEMLGDIESIVGEYDACSKCWNDALLLWTQLNEKGKTARLHRKMAYVFWNRMGKTEEAKYHHDTALKILEAEPESVELATLYDDICNMLWRTGDLAAARSRGEKALELAKKLNAHEVVASAYIDLGTISARAGEGWKISVEYTERALKIALDNGYMEIALRAYNNLPMLLPAEEHERGLDLLEKGFELARKVGSITSQSWIGINLADTYIGMGNMDKALLLAEEAVALDRKSGEKAHLPSSLGELGYIHQILGELDKSEQYYMEALSTSQKLNEIQNILGIYWLLGWFHLDRGEHVKAREFYEKQYDISEKAGEKSAKMWAAANLLWVYVELGEFEKVVGSIDGLYKFWQGVENNFMLAQLDALRGGFFRAQQKWEESIKYFERSLQEWELINARQWYMYWFVKAFLCEYARTYLERDQQGDREKALNLLNQALEIYQKLGAKKDIEKVEAKRAFIETGKMVSKPKPTEYVSTGYADLDKLLYGGIPPNCSVALTSPSCNERELLIRSFLEAGAKKGEVAFHIAIDPGVAKCLAEEFPSNFYLFVCNPQADAIVREAPNVFKLKGVENLTDISIALTSAIRRLDSSLKTPRRICIGLVSDVLLQHHAVQTRRWLTALIAELKSTGFTILATMNPQIHPPQELQAILDLFEGEISIHEKEIEKGAERYLRIKKMGNQKYLENELPLKKEQP